MHEHDHIEYQIESAVMALLEDPASFLSRDALRGCEIEDGVQPGTLVIRTGDGELLEVNVCAYIYPWRPPETRRGPRRDVPGMTDVAALDEYL